MTREEDVEALTLPIEALMAQYHQEVWDVAQSDKPQYDLAGRETAKKLVAAIRELAIRALK